MHEEMRKRKDPFEVVFVSLDESEQEAVDYFKSAHGDYFMIDFNDDARQDIAREMQVSGIPHIVCINSKGETIMESSEARQMVIDSYRGKDFTSKLLELRRAGGDWTAMKGTTLGSSTAANAGTSNASNLSKDDIRKKRLEAFQKAQNKKKLMDMGFSEADVDEALDKFGDDVDRAADWLASKKK
jgi:Thioredoxin-like/UBA/TS-N domain